MIKKQLFKALSFSFIPAAAAILSLTSCACTDNRKVSDKNNGKKHDGEVADAGIVIDSPASITSATAEIKPFKDSKVSGKVTFTKVDGGIKIVADVEGLTPGKHGFHVHEFGDCSGEHGEKVGGHFNPTNSKHGGPDSPERHVGDFGNLEANDKGHAHYERTDKLISFEGDHSIIGRSVIVHADADDLTTQPTGASGAKVACGIIQPTE